MLQGHRRVAVVGTSGSGKTTFAQDAAERTGLPHVQLDELYWGPQWTPRDDFRDRLSEALKGDDWITDGNYGDVRDMILPRATALVWLDYSFPIVFGRALSRSIRRGLRREVLYSGNRERLWFSLLHRDGIPWWVIRTFRMRRREYGEIAIEFPHLEVIRLSHPREAQELLRGPAGPHNLS